MTKDPIPRMHRYPIPLSTPLNVDLFRFSLDGIPCIFDVAIS